MLLVAVIGLLVLGPERLPVAVRSASLWIGRLRRQFNQIRSEIEREIGADEIRTQLHNESILQDLRESRAALQESAREVQSSINVAAATPAADKHDA